MNTLDLFWEYDESIPYARQHKYHSNFMCKLPQLTLSVRWEDHINMSVWILQRCQDTAAQLNLYLLKYQSWSLTRITHKFIWRWSQKVSLSNSTLNKKL